MGHGAWPIDALWNFRPTFQRKQCRPAAQIVGTDSVDLKIETRIGHQISWTTTKLFHLQPAARWILVRIEIVSAPVVREPQCTIKLSGSKTGPVADVKSGHVTCARHRDVPAIAVVDHLLGWSTQCHSLEIAPHRDAPRNTELCNLRRRDAAVRGSLCSAGNPGSFGFDVLHHH